MQIRQLQIFVALAEEMSFTRAARRVHIVQSGVSSAIRDLERELGARLFERTTKLVTLTAQGQTLLTHARYSLAALETAKRCVSSAGDERAPLRVAVRPGVLQCFDLAAFVAGFRTHSPDFSVRISDMTEDEISSRLTAGTLDLSLSILVSPLRWQRFKTTPIDQDCWVVLCSHRHELASLSSVKLSDLRSQIFVDLTRETPMRQLIDAHYAEVGLTRHSAFEVSDPLLAISLVERNVGVSIMPARVVARSPKADDVHVIHLDAHEAFPNWQLVALTRDGRPDHTGGVASQFVKFLVDATTCDFPRAGHETFCYAPKEPAATGPLIYS